MPRRSRSLSCVDHTRSEYQFTTSAGFDYNYDPLASTALLEEQPFDPYTDDYPNSPIHRGYNPPLDLDGRDASNNYLDNVRRANSSLAREVPEASPRMPIPASSTLEYLRILEEPSEPLEDPSSSRKLLILDLNGTLVFRSPHPRREFKPRNRRQYRFQNHHSNQDRNASLDPYADPTAPRIPLRSVHPRPYLSSFTEYLFHPHTKEWLDIMVWSSAQPHSVAGIVERCFGDRKEELTAIWARDTLGLEKNDYDRKTQTIKDLAKPWAAFPSLHPKLQPNNSRSETTHTHSAKTTLLLDDSPLKAHLQPWNHLCIREYIAELRQADLAAHLSEQDAKGLQGEGEDEADSREETTQVDDQGTDDEEEAGREDLGMKTQDNGVQPLGKRKRRRRTKIKGVRSAPVYDQTLLAIIGILDTVKGESNVAGWMKTGGLWVCNKITQTTVIGGNNDEIHTSADRHYSGSEFVNNVPVRPGETHLNVGGEIEIGAKRPKKRKRVNREQGGDGQSPPSAVSSSQVTETYPYMFKDKILNPRNDDTYTPENIGQWYEDPSVVDLWVRRGIRVLHELRIEVVSGIAV